MSSALASSLLFAFAFVLTATANAGQPSAPAADRPVDLARIRDAARRVEPELQGKPERLAQYIDFFRTSLANDRRLSALEVMSEAAGDNRIVLRGFAELPEARNALVAFLGVLGFKDIDVRIELLPSASLGEHRYGVVVAPHALSYEQSHPTNVGTDCLLGEPLFLLRKENDFFHVHAGDGYLGYVKTSDVKPLTESEFADYLDGPAVWMTQDHQAEGGLNLPNGGRLKLISEKDDAIIAETPTGQRVALPAGVCEIREPGGQRADVAIAAALELLGTKYLWGGKTSKGIDCSGLVQVSFGSAGVRVPRDANQQFHVGRLTATRWCTAGMRRGDTLYFVNPQGIISHTGIYLGDNEYIHAVTPTVTINSFDPAAPNYSADRHAAFAFARRLWE